ncbi:transposase [Streptomyces sp. H10-C2]|uniref:transposase n=1 Tax=unclassified Streptomyces TaxID=2593676 RepID=UPI0024B973C6|nr:MULTISPECIES: transposase [unclassified Streptomyces]MDJ0347037.1 transposase [Streptomyces sp. PH10-H1]MDJ0375305.1 transposase [Streptomyces sp. H10-C2]
MPYRVKDGAAAARYRGLDKTHVQHVLTAIAVNIERLCDQLPPGEPRRPQPPTAFQTYLDQQGMPRPRSWRFVAAEAELLKIPDRVKLRRRTGRA